MKTALIIIDPQNDFVNPKGNLYISGAENGIEEINKFIEEKGKEISKIYISQDTHQAIHIGHSKWWKPEPEEFTTITLQDVKNKTYLPRFYTTQKDIVKYINLLPDKKHNIWPEHCLEGSWGWCFPESLVKTLNNWCYKKYGKKYEVIQKGMNPNKEMYSVFSYANSDPSLLKYNTLLKELSGYDKIYISGFAKDVCVAWSVKDMIEYGRFNDKLVFLNKCMTGLNSTSKMLEIYENAVNNNGAIWE